MALRKSPPKILYLSHMSALVLCFSTSFGFAQGSGLPCQNGAPADPQYCKFIVNYAPVSYVDFRVSGAISMKPGDTTRSIAVIAGIDKYPNADGNDLPPAKIDVKKLTDFLTTDQHFDEIVVLKNEDVNFDNLIYFIQSYIPMVARKYDKVRVLIAYTGHGVPSGVPGTKGYVVLSKAKDEFDLQNLLNLGLLREAFSNLAPNVFQFLALINACYGGDVFGIPPAGGNIFLTNRPGANAMTAGAPDELVYSMEELIRAAFSLKL